MAQSANEVKKVITGWMDDMVGNIHTASRSASTSSRMDAACRILSSTARQSSSRQAAEARSV